MSDLPAHDLDRRLRCGIVLRVAEEECDLLLDGRRRPARFPSLFPSPRTERVQPGNLVATAATAPGVDVVVWRWYDAVVLDDEPGAVRLWEPAHGVVTASPRAAHRPGRIGARAYLSAGLPGADWWVAGPVVADPRDVDVELGEVHRIFTEHGLWDQID